MVNLNQEEKTLTNNDENIKKIYLENIHKEWDRLIKSPFHRLEFETTLHFLKKYLPKKGRILDAGGGPGRYTIELAKRGYDITLLDITPQNLEFAQKQIQKLKLQNRIEKIVVGSIVDLSRFKNNYFDAILCLGSPLSHINNQPLRAKAISELIRVAKKDAPIFISVMGKFGHLIKNVHRFSSEMKNEKRYFKILLKGDDNFWGGKGCFHYFTFGELKRLLGKKIKISKSIGLEGIGTASEKSINRLYKKPSIWKKWLKMHLSSCTHPTLVDMSIHFMIIGRKK